MIQIRNLCKIYNKKTTALKDLTIDLPYNNIIAILGLNGAGKSTLMKILLGLVKPNSGYITIKNSGKSAKFKFSYLPENFSADKNIKVIDLLQFLGDLYGIRKNKLNELIEQYMYLFEIYDFRNKKMGDLSKGMNIKVGIIQALMKDADYYLLDEPTEGLDPISRLKVREIVFKLKSEGATVIINSHILAEIELLADFYAVLHKGKLLDYKSSSELASQAKYEIEISEPPNNFEFNYTKKDSSWICNVSGIENLKYFITLTDSNAIKILNIKPITSSLEEYFNSLIQKQV